MKTSTNTLVGSLRLIAQEIWAADGSSHNAVTESADRMESMRKLLERAADIIHYQYPSEPSTLKWLADAKEIGITPCPF